MSKEMEIKQECCDIWNNLKDKTQMIDCLIESKQQIADLEAKLAEKQSKIQELNDMYEDLLVAKGTENELMQVSADCDFFAKENRKLKQQLAEKEGKIETLKQRIDSIVKIYSDDFVSKDTELKELRHKVKQHNQDKISFCIEKLSDVRSFVSDATEIKEPDYTKVCNYIDNQIEELKKENKNG